MPKNNQDPSAHNEPLTVDQMTQRIEAIKQELNQIGPMRPGRLSQQFQDPKGARRPYWQISYTYKGRSRTDYIKDPLVDDLRQQVGQYEIFKALVQEWTDLALQISIITTKEKAAKIPRKPSPRRRNPKP